MKIDQEMSEINTRILLNLFVNYCSFSVHKIGFVERTKLEQTR